MIRTTYLPSWGFLTTRYMTRRRLYISTSAHGFSNTGPGSTPPENTVHLPSGTLTQEGTLYSRHLSTPNAWLSVPVEEPSESELSVVCG